jgi:hypothetical protein
LHDGLGLVLDMWGTVPEDARARLIAFLQNLVTAGRPS